jgi:hypothetical protein
MVMIGAKLNSKNNGGSTDYYALPLPSISDIELIICKIEDEGISVNDAAHLIQELCPQTLNDLIEYKDMKPWQHEVFKACYAIKERAVKNGGSFIREINKIIYYALRGKKLNEN